jgi:hypothetical protein
MIPLSLATGRASIIGNYCISHPKGQFSNPVGDLICLGQKFYNDTAQKSQWGGSQSHRAPTFPLANFPKLAKAWNNLTMGIERGCLRGYTGPVGNEFTQSFPMTGSGPVW